MLLLEIGILCTLLVSISLWWDIDPCKGILDTKTLLLNTKVNHRFDNTEGRFDAGSLQPFAHQEPSKLNRICRRIFAQRPNPKTANKLAD